LGTFLFIATLFALFIMLGADFFSQWYRRFLIKRSFAANVTKSIMHLLWLVLAIIFWFGLLNHGLPKVFDTTYVLYSLFVFSVYGLIKSFKSRD
jgi:hypothetical protein